MVRCRSFVLLSIGLLWILAVSGAGAAEPEAATAAPLKITLDSAISQAVEKNSNILPAKLDLELARISLQAAEADQVLSPNPTTLRQRRLAVEKAETNLTTLVNKVRREVSKQAFSILQAEQTVTLNGRKLTQARDDLATVQLKIDLQMESNISLLNAKKSVMSAEKAVADSQTALAIERMSFLQYIGAADILTPFTLEVTDFELQVEAWDEAKTIQLALQQTSAVTSARETLEGAELDLRLNDAGFTPASDRRKYEIAVEKARRTLEEEEKKVHIQVRQYLSDLASLQKDLSMAEITLQVAQEQLVAVKLKYDQGIITETQVQTQENTVIQSQLSLLDTKYKIRDKQQELRDYLGV